MEEVEVDTEPPLLDEAVALPDALEEKDELVMEDICRSTISRSWMGRKGRCAVRVG
jgi:hypothetical protein